MAQHSVAQQAQRALEVHLLDGSWPVGVRLPAERVLAETLGVSRNSLRETIFCLKARGLLVSKWGSGGHRSIAGRHFLALAATGCRSSRLALGHTGVSPRNGRGQVHYAALRADKSDLKKIEGIIKRLTGAYETGDKNEEYRADADFHGAIAEASHNSMFLNLHAGILRMLREHISLNLMGLEDPSGKITDELRREHLGIWDAIRRHQPHAARLAMLAHIDFTRIELARRQR